MNLGSWKCGSNVRVVFDNKAYSSAVGAKHMAASRGLMRNHNGPQVPIEKAKTLKYFEADGETTANVFSNADCSGGSTFLWTDSTNMRETRIGLVFGDYKSAAIPAGV